MSERNDRLEEGGGIIIHNGVPFVDSGYLYTPYVPLANSPPIIIDFTLLESVIDLTLESVKSKEVHEFDWRKEGF